MKAYVRHIGVIDRDNRVHAVSFSSGVNIVTGKSSTGKSALIEIFDYCFGSSDFTVPEGIITACAEIYFTIVNVNENNLILARRIQDTKAFLKSESKTHLIDDPSMLSRAYFDDDYFLSLYDFKKTLNREFGIRVTDVDENLVARSYRGKKSSSPSIRSFMSYILQHQNLIANKHAIFYRFDEKAKREQAIDHLKVFIGFADQTYFIKSQELNALKDDKRKLEIQIPKAANRKKEASEKLKSALEEYTAISGKDLDIGEISDVVSKPKIVLDKLNEKEVDVVAGSDEHVRIKKEAERERSKLTAALRKKQQELADIKSSIRFAKMYSDEAEAVSLPQKAEVYVSKCPFCQSEYTAVEHEANKLNNAILWLNQELGRTRYLLESFEEQEKKISRESAGLRSEVNAISRKIQRIDQQITDLGKYRTQYELALKSKLRIESVLEQLLEKPEKELQKQLNEINKRIKKLNRYLRDNYNIIDRLDEAEKAINLNMADIGDRFEFEDSFRPVNLNFSLRTFDLWHDTGSKKVFLRSMGSGANWLYSHVTLFLSLHRYFCSLGEECLIPSILFFDQPSQVYFPSVLDNTTEFSPESLAEKEGDTRKRPVDEDIKAVTNLYSQLVEFCQETLRKTGIEPQIIVTDHADNLKIDGDVSFDSLVQGRRWRTRGFIETPEVSE